MKSLPSILCALLAAPLLHAAGTNRPALLQLNDGSSLHGALESIAPAAGLKWSYPAATRPLQFLLTNLASVRFEQAEAGQQPFQSSSRFYFKNGDEIIGNLNGITNGQAAIQTWFGDDVRAPVTALDSVSFSAKGYRLVYEGPNGLDGWKTGRNPRSWTYQDGSFIANGADLLGRDFGLSTSSSLEFDLAWNGAFSLSITLYAETIDRFDYSSSAYLIYLGTGTISVQRVQRGSGAVLLGQTQIPGMLQRNQMHFEIRCNKDDATIALYADGQFVQKWKDNTGFVAKGSGIVFFSQSEPRAMKLSNIRVAEWEGKFEPEMLTNAPPNLDIVFLANRDKVMGQVNSVGDGKMNIDTKQGPLDIPLERITQVRFREPEGAAGLENAMVRAAFPGGESLGFNLEDWQAGQVVGTSPIFGRVSFDPDRIRQLTFGPAANSRTPVETLDAQFPGFE